MASFDEFVSAVQSSIEALKQAQSSMDAPKQQAEELSSQFQGLGAESMATGSQGLKEGVEKTHGMVPPIITQLEQIITSAQGMKSGLRAPSPDVRPPPTPLDAAPPSLREPAAKVGDPVTAPEPGPGAYRRELESADEDDKGQSKFRRFGRALVRNAEDLEAQAEDTATSTASLSRQPEPPGSGETYETTTVQPPPVVITNPGHAAGPTDLVGTAVIMTAVMVEGVGRLMRRKDRDGG